MTMENPGHEGTKPGADNAQPPVAGSVRNPSRRRFNRAGVGASAVVLTLASRSVLADTICKTPSGFDSLAPSMAGGTKVNNCMGKPVSQWLLQDTWPIAKDAPFASIFGDGYPNLYAGASTSAAGTASAASNAGKSWFESFNGNSTAGNSGNAHAGNNGVGNDNGKGNGVVKTTATASNDLLLKDATLVQALAGSRTPPVVKYLIAALLNFRAGYNSFPEDTDVVRIFQQWQKYGYYEVRAAVKWYEADITKYLASVNSVG